MPQPSTGGPTEYYTRYTTPDMPHKVSLILRCHKFSQYCLARSEVASLFGYLILSYCLSAIRFFVCLSLCLMCRHDISLPINASCYFSMTHIFFLYVVFLALLQMFLIFTTGVVFFAVGIVVLCVASMGCLQLID